jgi:hypothetical protein
MMRVASYLRLSFIWFSPVATVDRDHGRFIYRCVWKQCIVRLLHCHTVESTAFKSFLLRVISGAFSFVD